MTHTTKTYKGYMIRIVGLSHYIYRPGQFESDSHKIYSAGFEQSMAAAKRWINEDIKRINEKGDK